MDHRLSSVLKATYLDYFLIFLAVFTVGIYWQFSQTIGDPDGFYHAKIAVYLSRGVFLKQLPWAYFTTLKEAYTDHHLLYHILLVPFVKAANPLLGVKLATTLFTASFFTVFYWFLKRLKCQAPFWFTSLLLFVSFFTFRLNLIRANSLSLVVLLFLLAALMEKRYWLVAALNFIYVWLYGGWLVGWLVAAAYVITAFIYWRRREQKPQWHVFRRGLSPGWALWRLLGATVAGSVAGLVINPYWPQNLYFYWQQIWQIAIVNQGDKLFVGGEWASLDPASLMQALGLLLPSLFIAFVLLILNHKRIKLRSWLMLVLTLIFIIFTAKSQRYIELAAPFAVIFSASVWSDIFPPNVLTQIFSDWQAPHWLKDQWIVVWLCGLMVGVFTPGIGLWHNISVVRADLIKGGIAFSRYQPASDWLAHNTPAGSIVVHSDWDDWPMLFYHNDSNYYLVGLDPTFMYNYDQALHFKWVGLTRDGQASNPWDLVTEELKSRYVVIENDHQAMKRLFSSNIFFRLVYQDAEVSIYQAVRPQET